MVSFLINSRYHLLNFWNYLQCFSFGLHMKQYAVALEEKEASLPCWDKADKEVCFLWLWAILILDLFLLTNWTRGDVAVPHHTFLWICCNWGDVAAPHHAFHGSGATWAGGNWVNSVQSGINEWVSLEWWNELQNLQVGKLCGAAYFSFSIKHHK